VDTTDEWIRERTGIRERRIAAPEEALTDLALPAAHAALAQAGVEAKDIDYLVCATVTPDMMFPTSSALLADGLGAPDAAAYDLLAGCTGFMYALAQAYGMIAAGLSKRALVVGGDVLSRILDWTDRSTLVLFGDGAGAVVLEKVERGGFLGFELGADGGGGVHLSLPGSGSRRMEDATANGYVHMNGREVFKFATRVLVSSAQSLLEECGVGVEDVDVYIPHQANIRIMNHAVDKLGIPRDRMVVNVDRYGNTSSGSIPLALADAQTDGRLEEGSLVLMTGMGAGLTWGSALIEWTEPRSGA
jgi:3-oxoacyl-[acyl-carrier-protein] synthase-3